MYVHGINVVWDFATYVPILKWWRLGQNARPNPGLLLQAQTVANFFLAFDQNLAIVPVLNKIDMVSADPHKVAEEMQQVIMCALAEAQLSAYMYMYTRQYKL